MLPFMKPKKSAASVIISHRKPDSDAPKPLDEHEDSGNEAMKACAEDILRAISAKDSEHLARAIQAAIDCAKSESNEEDNSYDAQNEKAAE